MRKKFTQQTTTLWCHVNSASGVVMLKIGVCHVNGFRLSLRICLHSTSSADVGRNARFENQPIILGAKKELQWVLRGFIQKEQASVVVLACIMEYVLIVRSIVKLITTKTMRRRHQGTNERIGHCVNVRSNKLS